MKVANFPLPFAIVEMLEKQLLSYMLVKAQAQWPASSHQ